MAVRVEPAPGGERAPLGSGLLTDLLARQLGPDGGRAMRAFCGIDGAADALGRERLVARISDGLLAFWRSQAGGAQARNGPVAALAGHVRSIARAHKEAVCLHAEVSRSHLREVVAAGATAARGGGPGGKANAFERHQRLQEFWPNFHSRLKPPQPEGIAKVRVDSPASRRSSLSQPGSRPESPGGELGRELSWKERSSSSRVSAGEWDWTRGIGAEALQKELVKAAKARTWGSPKAVSPVARLDRLSPKGSDAGGSLLSPLGRSSISLHMAESVSAPRPTGSLAEAPSSDMSPAPTGSLGEGQTRGAGRRWWRSSTAAEEALSPAPSPDAARRSSRALGHSLSLPCLERTALPSAMLASRPKPPALVGRLPSAPRSRPSIVAAGGSSSVGGKPPSSLAPLQVVDAAVVPWRGGGIPTRGPWDSPMLRYLQACNQGGVVPALMPFVTGHSLKLQAAGQMLGDLELSAIIRMMDGISVEEIDLEGNAALTDQVLVHFAESLRGGRASSSLTRLSLKGCPKLGLESPMNATVQLLSDPEKGLLSLRRLDLSNVPVSAKHHLRLCQAIGDHTSLETVLLVDIGLGKRGGNSKSSLAKQCIDALFRNSLLRHLDIGWNSFGWEIFQDLGRLVVTAESLRHLGVASCSSLSAGAVSSTPVVYLLEELRHGSPLTSLDISSNRLDFRGALIMEDAMEGCKRLTDLVLDGNPLGVLGLRSLCRLLCNPRSGMNKLRCEDCFSGMTDPATVEPQGCQLFSRNSPENAYALDLERPYHRAILRMLYKLCDRMCLKADLAFREISATPAFNHASKGADGVYIVPTSGRLAFTFSSEDAVSAALKGVAGDEFGAVVQRRFGLVDLQPNFKTIIPLLANFQAIRGRTEEQRVMLDALSKDFALTYPQLRQLCSDRSVAADVVARLLPRLRGGAPARCLAAQLLPSVSDAVVAVTALRPWLAFNVENPTGRYRLDLGKPCEFSVAEQLKVLDSWEASMLHQKGLPDTSERGMGSRMRNVTYRHAPLDAPSVARWTLPEIDALELDYSSTKRPPKSAPALDAVAFQSVVEAALASQTPARPLLEALRSVSDQMYLTSLQLRRLLGLFVAGPSRTECLVMFFGRVVDPHNDKVFRVACQSPDDLRQLHERLGFVEYFPFLQPEQACWSLNLARPDQRLAAHVLRQLAEKEDPANLLDADGNAHAGMPKSWGDALANVATEGLVQVSYAAAPAGRNFALRKDLAEKFGFVTIGADEERQVDWWAPADGAPADVASLAEFLAVQGLEPAAAFSAILGAGDERQSLTFAKLEEWMAETECAKFRTDTQKRLKEVYRFFDKGDAGSVTAQQWEEALGPIYRELRLCAHEFSAAVERQFGADLEAAWRRLDAQGAGQVEAAAWKRVLPHGFGFHGPALPVFRCLDKECKGKISFEEFCEVKRFLLFTHGQ